MFKKNTFKFIGCTIFWATNAFAQDIGTSTPPISAPISVKANNINDVGLWGINATDDNIIQQDTNLWQNSNTYNLNYLFGKLDSDIQFPTVQKLLRNIVFSGGAAPNATITTANNRFLLAYRLGPITNIKSLYSGYPNIQDSIYLAGLYADSLLANGDKDEACNLVSSINPNSPNKQILELRAVCYALNKEGAAAQLSLDLSKTIGGAQPYDSWLTRAITYSSAFDGNSQILGSFPFRADNGRQLALSKVLGLKPSLQQINTLSPLIISSLLKSDSSPEIINRARILGITYNAPNIEIDVNGVNTAQTLNDFRLIAIQSKNSLNNYVVSETTNSNIIDAALLNGDNENAKKIGEVFGYKDYQKLIFAIINNDANAINQNEDLLRSLTDKSLINIAIASGLKINDFGMIFNTNPSVKNIQNIEALDYALARNSYAEIILNIALILQKQDPKTIDTYSISKSINGLRSIGLEKEAKELAVYTILAKNIKLYKPQIKTNPPAKPIAPSTKPIVKTDNNKKATPDWGQHVD